VSGKCYPFNYVWTQTDDNHIPLNGEWAWQVAHPAAAPDFRAPSYQEICRGRIGRNFDYCTNQNISFADSFFCHLWYGRGHINWSPATYTGLLTWEYHTSAPPAWRTLADIFGPFGLVDDAIVSYIVDDDYNFRLQVEGDRGLTATNGGTFGVEFDSDETIDAFSSTWWRAFHNFVDNHGDSTINEDYGYREGTVVGEFGLDAAENYHSELHPAWGFAMNTKIDGQRDSQDDVWAVFARNSGNQGACGYDDVQLQTRSLAMSIPWWPGATSVAVVPGASELWFDSPLFSGRSIYGLSQHPGSYAVLNFPVGDPALKLLIDGTIHLRWTCPGGCRPIPPIAVATARRATAARGAREPERPAGTGEAGSPERLLLKTLSNLSTTELRRLARVFPRSALRPPGPALHRRALRTRFMKGRAFHRPKVRVRAQPARANAQRTIWRVLCAATKEDRRTLVLPLVCRNLQV
jgi:hypothetical protein